MFAHIKELFTRPSGYQISRSVRFRSSASAYLSRTPAVASNRKTWTWSGWIKRGTLSANQILFGSTGGSTSQGGIRLLSTNVIDVYEFNGSADVYVVDTSAVYRDPAAWYHIVVAMDTTQATAANRTIIWVNGVKITSYGATTYPSLNLDTYVNSTNVAGHGSNYTGSWGQFFDGYLAEVNFIDGQALTPTSFGETDAVTGVWKPKKYTGTYGNNGFYLNFSDNSAATAAAIGKDYSGNGNNFTPTNISVTAGVTYDSMTDVPTLTSATAANYPVWNPIKKVANNYTITDANLTASDASAANTIVWATMYLPTSGKFYWEITNVTGSGLTNVVGAAPDTYADSTGTSAVGFYRSNGQIQNTAGTNVTSGNTYTNGDVIGVAVDVGAGTVQFYKNNVAQGATPSFTFTAGSVLVPFCAGDNTAGTKTYAANFGQRPFSYTPPTGFVALNTQNLPTPSISNGANYMAATLYTGNAASPRSISNAVNSISFQPDFVWIKDRSTASFGHNLYDSVRGTGKLLISNANVAEITNDVNGYVSAFNTNGFALTAGSSGINGVNANTDAIVGWQWNAGGSTVTNTTGSISAQVRANPTAGFSIVTYTGTGANATVGHGLGVAPKMIFVKKRSAIQAWSAYHASLANTQYLVLDTTAGAATLATMWNSTTPTSSVFSVGTDGNVNTSTATYVAYCFSEVAGYSKIGSYTGNGSADGPFVYCGFLPRFIMVKRTDAAFGWFIWDTTRSPSNQVQVYLQANAVTAEQTFGSLDVLANGFKIRGVPNDFNASGSTQIFMAFAENPFKLSLAR